MSKSTLTTTLAAIVFIACATSSRAAMVTLQNPTATFEQAGFPISDTIDDVLAGDANGWAFGPAGQLSPQTGVYQTVSPINANELEFTLTFGTTFAGHKFQDIRLSYTTDAAPTTVSGATWTELTPTTVSADLATATIDGNNIEYTGNNGVADVYTVNVAGIDLTGVTGFRLETFLGANNALGFTGAGNNGNVVLSEFQVDAVAFATTSVPEPTAFVLALFGLLGLCVRRRGAQR